MQWTLIAVVTGFMLDLILGDPQWLYHPVRLVGKLITVIERIIRGCFPENRWGEFVGGALLTILVLGISAMVPWVILTMIYQWNTGAGCFVESIVCYQLFAAKSLRTESMKVYHELEKGDLAGARRAVSMIVGRDTAELTEEGITKAAVETIAENASDGVIAPMIYMMLGGATLGWAYKAINTMDSMVGYKNEKYQYFGTFAAKLDDVVNFIPSRLSAWAMIAVSFILGFDGKNAVKIYRRDNRNHASPNSAQTEAAAAGALDIQLAGNAHYFGKLYEKKTIGDPIREIEKEDIKRANRLLYGTAILSMVVCAGGYVGVLFVH